MDDDALKALKVRMERYGWKEEAVILGIEQDFRCIYCGRDLLASIEDYDTWQFDHIIPVSKSGPDATTNKAVACKLCNFVKCNFDVSKLAGPNAPIEDLKKLAAAHVQARREDKRKKLREIKAILKDAGLLTDERLGPE
jgi:5-methylcytosine-specific restriction endonuclease McrA